MADNDDKTNDAGAGKKTLTLKGAPHLGNRPGMSRSSRTVVVEKRTRRVGGPGAPVGNGPATRPLTPQSPTQQSSSPRVQLRSSQPGSRQPMGLSATENDARMRALREAGMRQAEDPARAAAEEARRA